MTPGSQVGLNGSTLEVPSPTVTTPISVIVTLPNEFGLSKAFSHHPSHDPEVDIPLESLCDIKHISPPEQEYAGATHLKNSDDSRTLPDTGCNNDSDSESRSGSDPKNPLLSRSVSGVLQHFLYKNLNSQEGFDDLMNDILSEKIKIEEVKKVAG